MAARISPEVQQTSTEFVSTARPQGIPRARMPELDALRGAAIFLVLLYHGFGPECGIPQFSTLERIFADITAYGWVGVDLFFVLSGFLITGILLDTRGRPDFYRRFYIRRALRILPIYWATLLALALITRTPLFRHPVPWSFLGISFLFLANFNTIFRVPLSYGVLWSLAVEEHFYMLWPTVVRKLSDRGVGTCAAAVCVVCPALRAVSFMLHRGLGGTDYGAYTWLVADSLATGALFAVAVRGPLQDRDSSWKLSGAALCGGLAMLVAGAPFGILKREQFLGMTLRQTALNIFCLGVLVLTLLVGTGPWKRIVCFRPLRLLGEISYGVYLLHTFLLWIVDRCTEIFLPQLPPVTGHFFWLCVRFGVSCGLTILLCYFSRWYFEEPFLRLKERFEHSLSFRYQEGRGEQ